MVILVENKIDVKTDINISLYTYENTFQIMLQDNILHIPGVSGFGALFSLSYSL